MISRSAYFNNELMQEILSEMGRILLNKSRISGYHMHLFFKDNSEFALEARTSIGQTVPPSADKTSVYFFLVLEYKDVFKSGHSWRTISLLPSYLNHKTRLLKAVEIDLSEWCWWYHGFSYPDILDSEKFDSFIKMLFLRDFDSEMLRHAELLFEIKISGVYELTLPTTLKSNSLRLRKIERDICRNYTVNYFNT